MSELDEAVKRLENHASWLDSEHPTGVDANGPNERAADVRTVLSALKEAQEAAMLSERSEDGAFTLVEQLNDKLARLAVANKALRALQEATKSNNTKNPWLGVCASVALLQMDLAAANERAEKLERAIRQFDEAHEALRPAAPPVPHSCWPGNYPDCCDPTPEAKPLPLRQLITDHEFRLSIMGEYAVAGKCFCGEQKDDHSS